jgi:ADP-heptose:LPS heptosyltransferase
MSPSFRWHLVALLAGSPYRYGYRAKGAGFLLTHPLKDTRFRRPRHEVETTLDLIRALDIPVADKRLRIYITAEATESTARFLEECLFDKTRPLIVIHPGSHAPRVRWAIEDFAQVADVLVAKYGANIIIVGSEKETNLGRRLSKLMKSKSINACGRTGLQELAALLRHCHLFIGNSSGPMQLAAAVGTPTIAIFGNIYPLDSYRRWRPWSETAVVLHKDVGCSECLPWSCRDMACMKAITPEDVLKDADRFLKGWN